MREAKVPAGLPEDFRLVLICGDSGSGPDYVKTARYVARYTSRAREFARGRALRSCFGDLHPKILQRARLILRWRVK